MVSPRRRPVRVTPRDRSGHLLLPHAGGPVRGFGPPGEARAPRGDWSQLLRSAEGFTHGLPLPVQLPEDGEDDAATAAGRCKPSVILAEMLEFCPAGESSTAVFAFLFLQRLPQEIRVLLSEDDPADMSAIAEKADRLIAMHVP